MVFSGILWTVCGRATSFSWGCRCADRVAARSHPFSSLVIWVQLSQRMMVCLDLKQRGWNDVNWSCVPSHGMCFSSQSPENQQRPFSYNVNKGKWQCTWGNSSWGSKGTLPKFPRHLPHMADKQCLYRSCMARTLS